MSKRAGRILKEGGSAAGASSGQRLLKPHSFPLSWRDKKGAAGGTQLMGGQGYHLGLLCFCVV